jgi:subtilisin family serine protease
MTEHARTSRAMNAVRALIVAALLAASATVFAGGGGDATVTGEVLVKLGTTAALDPLLAKYPLVLIDRFGRRPIYRLKVAGPVSVKDMIAALSAEPGVLIAEPNFVHSAPEARKNVVWAIGTPTAYSTQWAPQAMHLSDAHRIATGDGVRVAVLDTGVDRMHPLLAGRLVPGFDFVDFDPDPSEGSSLGTGYGHGTHVAGLVALAAPGATIMPLRVLDPSGQGNAWVLAEAMLYAVDPDGNPDTDDGAHVINMSLGSISRTRLFSALSQLVSCSVPDVGEAVDPAADVSDPGYDGDKRRCANFGGAVVVAAAGNDASDAVREYPAAEGAYGLVAVAASNSREGVATFSNFGSWIDVAAPGDRITSSVPGGGYGTWSGTSMAAPLASGVAALLREAEPQLDADSIARRVVLRSSTLCGAALRQIDALAALLDTPSPPTLCP